MSDHDVDKGELKIFREWGAPIAIAHPDAASTGGFCPTGELGQRSVEIAAQVTASLLFRCLHQVH